MLAPLRTVLEKVCLARWQTSAASPTATIRIEIEGCDPRVVVVPRLWLERAVAWTGTPDASGVSWSTYSAGEDSMGALIPLQVVQGASNRPLVAGAELDGIIPQGDNLELQCATALIVIVLCQNVSAVLTSSEEQELWFGLEAYPADPSLSPMDFVDLLHLIRVSSPSPIAIAVNT